MSRLPKVFVASMGAILAVGVASLLATGKAHPGQHKTVIKETGVPHGVWTLSATPYMGPDFTTIPIDVTGVTLDASKGLTVTKVGLRNHSDQPVQLPLQQTIKDGSDTRQAETIYEYDNYSADTNNAPLLFGMSMAAFNISPSVTSNHASVTKHVMQSSSNTSSEAQKKTERREGFAPAREMLLNAAVPFEPEMS